MCISFEIVCAKSYPSNFLASRQTIGPYTLVGHGCPYNANTILFRSFWLSELTHSLLPLPTGESWYKFLLCEFVHPLSVKLVWARAPPYFLLGEIPDILLLFSSLFQDFEF